MSKIDNMLEAQGISLDAPQENEVVEDVETTPAEESTASVGEEETSEEQVEAESEEQTTEVEEAPTEEQVEQLKEAAEADPELLEKQLRVPVGNGQFVDLSVKDLIDAYEPSAVSQQRFQDAARLRKQSEQFIDTLRTDPESVLRKVGYSDAQIREMAEEYLMEQIQLEKMDEEQRKGYEAQKRVQELEAEHQAQQQQMQQQELEAAVRERLPQLEKSIKDALSGVNLPVNPQMVARVAETMGRYIQIAQENPQDKTLSSLLFITPQDIIEEVKDKFINDTKAIYGDIDTEQLLDMLGNDVVGKIKNYEVQKVKRNEFKPTPPNKPPAQKKKTRKHITQKEFLDSIGYDEAMRDYGK